MHTKSHEDGMSRHFATAVSINMDNQACTQLELENLEIRRRLRNVPWFKVLTNGEIAMLADKCQLVQYQQSDVIMRQGSPGDSMQIVHSGVVTIYLRKNDDKEKARSNADIPGALAPNDYGEEIATREEGEMMGEMSLLTGQRRTATVVAATNCIMINVNRAALQPLLQHKPELAHELAELMHSRLSGKPFTTGVTLRLHQVRH
jgi:CRP-like cAMP-binding protein